MFSFLLPSCDGPHTVIPGKAAYATEAFLWLKSSCLQCPILLPTHVCALHHLKPWLLIYIISASPFSLLPARGHAPQAICLKGPSRTGYNYFLSRVWLSTSVLWPFAFLLHALRCSNSKEGCLKDKPLYHSLSFAFLFHVFRCIYSKGDSTRGQACLPAWRPALRCCRPASR